MNHAPVSYSSSRRSRWGWFLVRWLLVLGVGGLLYFGWPRQAHGSEQIETKWNSIRQDLNSYIEQLRSRLDRRLQEQETLNESLLILSAQAGTQRKRAERLQEQAEKLQQEVESLSLELEKALVLAEQLRKDSEATETLLIESQRAYSNLMISTGSYIATLNRSRGAWRVTAVVAIVAAVAIGVVSVVW